MATRSMTSGASDCTTRTEPPSERRSVGAAGTAGGCDTGAGSAVSAPAPPSRSAAGAEGASEIATPAAPGAVSPASDPAMSAGAGPASPPGSAAAESSASAATVGGPPSPGPVSSGSSASATGGGCRHGRDDDLLLGPDRAVSLLRLKGHDPRDIGRAHREQRDEVSRPVRDGLADLGAIDENAHPRPGCGGSGDERLAVGGDADHVEGGGGWPGRLPVRARGTPRRRPHRRPPARARRSRDGAGRVFVATGAAVSGNAGSSTASVAAASDGAGRVSSLPGAAGTVEAVLPGSSPGRKGSRRDLGAARPVSVPGRTRVPGAFSRLRLRGRNIRGERSGCRSLRRVRPLFRSPCSGAGSGTAAVSAGAGSGAVAGASVSARARGP